jgi:hypothetical protein
MLNKFFFLFLFIMSLSSLLFLSGCSGGSSSEIGGFLGGTKGLLLGVEDGAPPREILDAGAGAFPVVISLANVGETSVGPGTDSPLVFVRLAGIDYNSFGLTNQSAIKVLDEKLEPARRNFDGTTLNGDTTFISFDNLAYGPDVATNVPLTLRIELCYDYESYASTTFCMKSDILKHWDDNSVCNIVGSRPVGNSGSPLHITSVDEKAVNDNTVQINFVIEHVGNGAFFYRSSYSSPSDLCFFGESNPNIDKFEIFFEPVQKGTYDIKCPRLDNQSSSSEGIHGVIKMIGNAPITVSCYVSRLTSTGVQAYTDLINIRMRYRYGGVVELPITVLASLYSEN